MAVEEKTLEEMVDEDMEVYVQLADVWAEEYLGP